MAVLKCGYLGPAGTFTEEAGLQYFGEGSDLVSLNSINEIFTGIREGRLDRGIVPVENSLEGPVNITMDLLFKDKEITITGEEVLKIRHFLIASPGVIVGEITRLYSHVQAIGQTSGFIDKYLPGVEIYYTDSTARAAGIIKDDRESGLIGSRRISQLYDLEVLAEDIQDYQANFTRFLIIGRSASRLSGSGSGYKTSIICAPEVNQAGVLYQILGSFARAGINLTRIESRPTKRQLGEYLFYIDFIGHSQDPEVKDVLDEVRGQSGIFRLIGSYLRADPERVEEQVAVETGELNIRDQPEGGVNIC